MSKNTHISFFKQITTSDVKELLSCQGRCTLHGRTCEFKYPACNDTVLGSILQDNNCTCKIVGQPQGDNCTYEISGNGKTCQVKIACC